MRIEHWWFTLPLRLKSIFQRRRLDRELDEELQFHLEHKIEEGLAAGLAPAVARRRALLALGGIEQRKEEMREVRRVRWLTDFGADVQYAWRSIGRTPALSAFVVFTLAVGIGMTAAPFSMLDALVFRPYPVPRSHDVVQLVSTTHDTPFDNFSDREYLDIRDHARSYTGVVASSAPTAVGFSSAPGATAQVRTGMLVSGNYFAVLGVEPRLGRGFRADEDIVPGRDAVAVLGWDFWQREFGGAPSVVGRRVRVNNTEVTVVGVAPESFPGLHVWLRPDVYLPLAMAPAFSTNPQKRFFADRDDRELTVRGRLRPGTSVLQANNELVALGRDFRREYPPLYRDRSAAVHTQTEMRTRADDGNWKFVAIGNLLAVAVLLVACTNVAGLLLSRARTRRREIAVRLALGSGRSRLVRMLLTESLVLATLGGVGGVAVGYVAVRLLATFQIPADLQITNPFSMDGRVLTACFLVAVASALLCGLAPALQSTHTDLVTGLKSSETELPGRKRLWGRSALVVVQVAMSLMLVTTSFLMAHNFRDSTVKTSGFFKDHLLMTRLDPRLVQYDADQTRHFYDALIARVRATPGVVSAAFTANPPLGLDRFDTVTFVPDGYQMPRDRESFASAMDTVDEGYFATMGIAIVRGRAFLSTDTAAAPRVAVVNEQLANRYWPGADPIGRHVRLDGRSGAAVEIVGVARTIKYRAPTEKPQDFLYMPLAQEPRARLVLLTRTSADPGQLVAPVRALVRALEPNMPIVQMRSYEDLYRYHTVKGPGIAIDTIGTLGAVGLLLTLAGLYGVMSYTVTRKTREIGIRMAIGAGRSAVLRLVIGKGLRLVGIGTVLGAAMGFAVEQLLNTALFDAGHVDVAVYLAVVPSMVLVTMLAAYLPALRASRIPPTLALRYE